MKTKLILLNLALLNLCTFGPGQWSASAQGLPAKGQPAADKGAFATTVDYVLQFYPLWFTYNQFRIADLNRLVGPDRISPIYHVVVAINDDTVYASSYLDLTAQPVILTIPPTTATYSVLTLDPYCDIIEAGIPAQTPGTYALTGPGFTGTLPAGVTRVPMPLNFLSLIFRADKFSAAGVDQTAEAKQFRTSLKTQTLSDFLNDPSGGATLILPEIAFAIPFKTLADTLIAKDPIGFLRQLQTAVAASNTPPMSPQVQALSQAFDSQFGNGVFGPRSKPKELAFSAGAQAAHELILEHYRTHTGPTGWITFTNIGVWGDDVIGRSAITEFIQYGNGRSTAAYYHSFSDGTGAALDGNDPHGYILTFPAEQIPQAKRFWSVTAYTPEAIELVPNLSEKYLVARYTPGLQYNADGSVSIYLATERPRGVPTANWLPIPRWQFNLILRVYGPEGAVADNTYVPPPINQSH